MFPNEEDQFLLRKEHPVTQLTKDNADATTTPMVGEKDFPCFQSPFFYVSDKVVAVELKEHQKRIPPLNMADQNPGIIAYARPGCVLLRREENADLDVKDRPIIEALLVTDVKHDIFGPNIVLFLLFSCNIITIHGK